MVPLKFGRLVTAILSATAMFASASFSGPDDVTKYFQNERVSLLDWGTLRISHFLLTGENGNPKGYARYDFDDDRVYVWGTTTNDLDLDASGFQEICKKWIDGVRLAALVHPNTGEPFFKNSEFAEMYSHDGYLTGTREDYDMRLAALDKKFHLIFNIMSQNYDPQFRCTAPLLGTGFASENLKKP